MLKKILPLLFSLLLLCAAARAEWAVPDRNLDEYLDAYSEASESYKAINYGASDKEIAAIKESLSALGFFPYNISNNYYKTLETAIRLFSQQMGLGETDGKTISPLIQAMLDDPGQMESLPLPVMDLAPYAREANGTSYTWYTFTRLSRKDIATTTTKVGFMGVIVEMTRGEGNFAYTVEMDGDPEKQLYVTYSPAHRATVFQVGDQVAVFGVTLGVSALPYPGMEAERVLVSADRMGFHHE